MTDGRSKRRTTKPARPGPSAAANPRPAPPPLPPALAHASLPGPLCVERAFGSAARIQGELIRFGAQRLHAAVRAQGEVMDGRTPAEVGSAQARYMWAMVGDYAAEWVRLTGYGLRPPDGPGGPPPSLPVGHEGRHATPI